MSCCCHRQKNNVQKLEGIFEPRYDNTPEKTKTKQNNTKTNRRESIYPKSKKREEITNNKNHIDEKITQRKEFTDKFVAEIIQCGSCQEKIALKERKQLYHCSNCNNFFCCKFAGACVGEECSIQFEGKKQSLSYCLACVNPYLEINTQDNGQCLCKKCENMPDIPNHYKEV